LDLELLKGKDYSMARMCLWAVVVCLTVFIPFAGMARAQGSGALTTPVAAKDLSEYGASEELFREPVFTVNGQALTERKQGARSEAPHLKSQMPNGQAQEVYGKLPLYFIQNDGQMDEQVKFYEKGSGHAMFFTEDGVYLSLTNGQEARSKKTADVGWVKRSAPNKTA